VNAGGGDSVPMQYFVDGECSYVFINTREMLLPSASHRTVYLSSNSEVLNAVSG